MKSVTSLLLVLSLFAVFAQAENPRRMDRADAFLGVHFDFHAGKTDAQIGARTTPEMVNAIIDRIGPDYIQCDCKGHPGNSSYPTKVGNPAPGIVGDPLRIWRDVTAGRGVALFMHYSGVYDSHAVEVHPDWAAVRADGKPDTKATSTVGPYAEKLLIPQLRELADVYGVDGVWVDGECWALVLDYSAAMVRGFREKYQADAPRKKDQPLWNEWKEFNREAFRAYLRKYIDALKASNPSFKVISNWAFSDHMPEPVSAGVASLSGDFSSLDSVNSARFTARCFENQGLPWDLMAWGFNKNTRLAKTPVALEQEAAVVLALGGGFQAYFKQARDGSLLHMTDLDVMGEVAKFCRKYQPFCHKSQAVPQVALLYSRQAHYRNSDGLFHPSGDAWLTDMRRSLKDLLACGQSVQVVSEHHLAGKMSQWPVIVVSGWGYLEPKFRDELVSYARAGGSLLLVGKTAVGLFAPKLGLADAGTFKAALVREIGKGKIGALPAGADVEPMLKQLFPSPLVEVSGSRDVDVCVRRLKNKLMVNLVNTGGNHANKDNKIVESVPPVGPLQITLRLAKPPKAVILQPDGVTLQVAWKDGLARVTLEKLDLYSIVQVEE